MVELRRQVRGWRSGTGDKWMNEDQNKGAQYRWGAMRRVERMKGSGSEHT